MSLRCFTNELLKSVSGHQLCVTPAGKYILVYFMHMLGGNVFCLTDRRNMANYASFIRNEEEAVISREICG